MRYVKNITSRKVHIASEKRQGFTICGQYYARVGFIPPIEIRRDTEINCKACLKKLH